MQAGGNPGKSRQRSRHVLHHRVNGGLTIGVRACRAPQHHKAIFYNRKQRAPCGPKLLCPSWSNQGPTFLDFDSHASPVDEVDCPAGVCVCACVCV